MNFRLMFREQLTGKFQAQVKFVKAQKGCPNCTWGKPLFATLLADLPHVLLPSSMYSFSPVFPWISGGAMHIPFLDWIVKSVVDFSSFLVYIAPLT
ncbi:MAG: hypothetical protein ONB46_15975 [candidate division KSB1 bacterium]|nr:hypothetical protein [candidate division KSB1 bacterium]MDZ7366850.1 hypothetical protein [candidate division KSB1 bacterium]MDZ7405143.1 hypothetical protein [candidate division KSB1 bacterium]